MSATGDDNISDDIVLFKRHQATAKCKETVDDAGNITCSRCWIEDQSETDRTTIYTCTGIHNGKKQYNNMMVSDISYAMRLSHFAKFHPGLLTVLDDYIEKNSKKITKQRCSIGNIVNFVCKLHHYVHPKVFGMLMRHGIRGAHMSKEEIMLANYMHVVNRVPTIDCVPNQLMMDYDQLLDPVLNPGDMEFQLASGEKIPAHSIILCIRCPYFRDLRKNCTNMVGSCIVVNSNANEFPQVTATVMREFLRYINSGYVSLSCSEDDTCDIMPQLLFLGDKYMVPQIVEYVISYLRIHINMKNVMQMIDIAYKLGKDTCKSLIEACKTFMDNNVFNSKLPVSMGIILVNHVYHMYNRYPELYTWCLLKLFYHRIAIDYKYWISENIVPMKYYNDYSDWISDCTAHAIIQPPIDECRMIDHIYEIVDDIVNMIPKYRNLVSAPVIDHLFMMLAIQYKQVADDNPRRNSRIHDLVCKLCEYAMTPSFFVNTVRNSGILTHEEYVRILEKQYLG